ncbi:hypothetical protein AALP_AAs43442U000100 [Arabis alpina]|uniref:RRM domain-containing protein n=1 Tax=Arabis alpina TaxID=50452 RepID=A0A087G371_ARAAL|nr:hypothetical protein AALP_AAs43442U000100 [Arabis alpina]
MPMLFLGHIHPYLLTILLRSFLDREVKDTDFLDLSPDLEHSVGLSVDHEHSISPAWTNTDDLEKRIGEIEFEMQPTLTSLVDRVNQAQIRYIGKWVSLHSHSHGANQPKIMDDEDDLVKELVSVLREANGLRTKVLDAVVKATTPHQKALFLEALCKFLSRFTYEFQVAVPVTTQQQQQPPPRLEPATETYCIFVGDLSLDITDRVLLEVFRARFPSTKAARVPFDHFKGHNKGYDFVGFTD